MTFKSCEKIESNILDKP